MIPFLSKAASAQSLGKKGESLAVDFLKKKRFQILAKNYRTPIGEIDLICRKGGRIFFVEIKTRSGVRFGRPEESVHPEKQRKMVRVAQWYLKEHGGQDLPAGFAVVSLLLKDPQKPEIRFFENAFEAGSER